METRAHDTCTAELHGKGRTERDEEAKGRDCEVMQIFTPSKSP